MNLRRITSAAVAAALAAFALLASTAQPARAQCTYYTVDTLATYGVVVDPVVIQLQQTQHVWSAFAVRPITGEDWDLALYQNSAPDPGCVANFLAGSSASGSIVDFVIGDYSYDPTGTYYARCNRYSGSNFAYVRWCESPQVMTVNAPRVNRSWGTNDVIETWNVQLSAGTTYTINFGAYGSLDAKVLLFRNPAASTYWAGRGSAELTSTTTTTYTAPSSGTYAVVVVNDNGGFGGFSLAVGTCSTPAALVSGATVHTELGYVYQQYTQSAAYWTALGVRSTMADYDMTTYRGTSGSWPFCFSDPKAASNGAGVVDFVIGDFNHNPTGSYYSYTFDFSTSATGADIEWDSGADLLTVNGAPISRNSDTTNVIEVWDIFLTAGQTYNFEFNPSAPNMHMLLFRNTGGGEYWSGRAGAQFDVTGCQSYTAPTSGYYGVVVTNETGGRATYTLGVSQAPCRCAVALNPLTPTSAGSPDAYFSFTESDWGWWDVIATRGATNADDWDLTVSGSATGNAAPTCLGGTLISSGYGAGLVDIGVIDFSYAPTGTYYARTHHFSGGAPTGLMEWDWSRGLYFHNGRVQTWAMPSNHLADSFNAYMEAGKTYVLDYTPSDVTIKLLVFENPGTSAYFVTRAAAVLTTSGVTTYTPTVTGYHGLVVVNDAAVNGSYSLRFGSCSTTPLSSGVPVPASEALSTYSFAQHASSWAAAGVRSLTTDWDIRVSATQTSPFPNCVGASLTGSSSSSLNFVDFVAGDFFHNPPGTYYVEANQYTNADVAPTLAQWNSGSGELEVNGVTGFGYTPISSGEMLHSWSVYLMSGTAYTFYFSQFGSSNLHMMLFRNPGGGTYWTGRASAAVDLTPGIGSITYTAPSTGEYGVVVVKDDELDDLYRLDVRACFPPTPLASGTVVADSSASNCHSFTQAAPSWTAVGVRSTVTDWDIDVNSNPSGGAPGICQTGLLATSYGVNVADFVVGDFNPGANLPGTYYVRTSQFYDPAKGSVEWDSGTDVITVGGSLTHRTTNASDVLEIWDVFLNAGQTYSVYFSHSGTADVKAMIFRNPGGAYWAPRDSNVYARATSGDYTAPTTGWYGVVVVNDNGAAGAYDLGIYHSTLAVQPDGHSRITSLSSVQPNPARSRMSIEYTLSQQAPVRLQMLDLAGRVVAEVENQTRDAGVWHADWNGITNSGTKAAPGIYLVRLDVGGRTIGQRKVTLLE